MAKLNARAIAEAIKEAKAASEEVLQGRMENASSQPTNRTYKAWINRLRRQLLTLLRDCPKSHKILKAQSHVYMFTYHLGKWRIYSSQPKNKHGKSKNRARILKAINRQKAGVIYHATEEFDSKDRSLCGIKHPSTRSITLAVREKRARNYIPPQTPPEILAAKNTLASKVFSVNPCHFAPHDIIPQARPRRISGNAGPALSPPSRILDYSGAVQATIPLSPGPSKLLPSPMA
ncbi:hypothetical protein PG999_005563 [Apiospora kogelbergensis]|uniref:Uncharacterized protein n=1 Tax=Apiospora kogelbergensis TaxID=1337665 RepID=A0AAW0R2J3_9PEZI